MHYLAELINPAPNTTEIRSPADTQSVALSCLLSHSLSITHPKHMYRSNMELWKRICEVK